MKIIDLSVPIHTGMTVYPGDPEVSIEVVHTYKQHSWELRRLSLGSHTGTHVDAYSHMHEGGKTLEQIPLDRFFGRAYIANSKGPLPIKAGLIFKEEADVELLDQVLSAQPPFVGGFISEALERALLQEEIITFTGLTNLHLLPENTPFMFYGFPLNIVNGDGSPVRAVAIVD